MERSKGIMQTEKVLLRFDRIPRLGIQINLRKPTKQASTSPETPSGRAEKQLGSEMPLQDVYRLIHAPL